MIFITEAFQKKTCRQSAHDKVDLRYKTALYVICP